MRALYVIFIIILVTVFYKINTFIYKTRYSRVAGNCNVILHDFVTCEFGARLVIHFGFKD